MSRPNFAIDSGRSGLQIAVNISGSSLKMWGQNIGFLTISAQLDAYAPTFHFGY